MSRLRGRVCWPISPERGVLLEDGVVEAGLAEPRPARPGDPAPVEGVIVPAFADWHFHWVQAAIAGTAGADLLTWLRTVAWPEEIRLADPAARADALTRALAQMSEAGTLAGAAYGTPDPDSAAEFLNAAPASFLCGPAVMTMGPPDALIRPLSSLRTPPVQRERFAVSPRFALSCGAEDLAELGRLAAAWDTPIQTHLAENEREVAEVARRFPEARDYTDVYDRAGLLGPKTLLGHVIHVSDDELAAIAAAGAIVVHCPTSNRALGSGRMPLERLRDHGVRWTLGSDVGAGPEFCMLDVMAEALRQHTGHASISAGELWHRATLGPGALFRGGSERAVTCAERPGALIVSEPPGGAEATTAEGWTNTWLARWRSGLGHGITSVEAWGD